jgi:hypothetical protein
MLKIIKNKQCIQKCVRIAKRSVLIASVVIGANLLIPVQSHAQYTGGGATGGIVTSGDWLIDPLQSVNSTSGPGMIAYVRTEKDFTAHAYWQKQPQLPPKNVLVKEYKTGWGGARYGAGTPAGSGMDSRIYSLDSSGGSVITKNSGLLFGSVTPISTYGELHAWANYRIDVGNLNLSTNLTSRFPYENLGMFNPIGLSLRRLDMP